MDEYFGMKVGDEITFRSPTRSGSRKATRKITGFRDYGAVTVTKYHGWTDFAVKLDEIISHKGNTFYFYEETPE